jgi:hypothetical protein
LSVRPHSDSAKLVDFASRRRQPIESKSRRIDEKAFFPRQSQREEQPYFYADAYKQGNQTADMKARIHHYRYRVRSLRLSFEKHLIFWIAACHGEVC